MVKFLFNCVNINANSVVSARRGAAERSEDAALAHPEGRRPRREAPSSFNRFRISVTRSPEGGLLKRITNFLGSG